MYFATDFYLTINRPRKWHAKEHGNLLSQRKKIGKVNDLNVMSVSVWHGRASLVANTIFDNECCVTNSGEKRNYNVKQMSFAEKHGKINNIFVCKGKILEAFWSQAPIKSKVRCKKSKKRPVNIEQNAK